jgi:hypothetical protein
MSKNKQAVRLAFHKGYRVVGGIAVSPQGLPRKCSHYHCRGRPVYARFNIDIEGTRYPVRVHQLAAYQKYGEAALAAGVLVRHLDGDQLNNRETNIAIGTPSDNMMDQPAEVRRRKAAHANLKVTEEFVERLRNEHATGVSYKALRKAYGIPLSTLSYYLSKRAKRTTYLFAA